MRNRNLRTRYLLSLPERALRSLAALAGGLAQEFGEVTVPAALRRTRLYQNLVEMSLRFLVERVGQVKGAYAPGEELAQDFVLRRTAGNGLELVGLLTFRASPVWITAALADLSGAGRRLVAEIAESLRADGLLEPGTRFETVDQLLDGLERSAAQVTATIATPPLDVQGLRADWREIRAAVAGIPSPNLPRIASLEQQWSALKQEAAAQGISVVSLSGLMALAAIRRTPGGLWRTVRGIGVAGRRASQVVNASLLAHYGETLREIHETGYLAYFKREFKPYLRAASENFSPRRRSLTQKLLSRRKKDQGHG